MSAVGHLVGIGVFQNVFRKEYKEKGYYLVFFEPVDYISVFLIESCEYPIIIVF
jgi:hypothetical protein